MPKIWLHTWLNFLHTVAGKDTTVFMFWSADCRLCLPPQLPATEFAKLGHFPDPIPDTDDHYKPFGEVFCTTTTEEHRPSAKHKAHKEKSLPFYASVQHRQMSCEEPIERLYYSAKFTDICVHCSAPVAPWNDKEQYYTCIYISSDFLEMPIVLCVTHPNGT